MRPTSRLTSHQSRKFIKRKKARGLVVGILIVVSIVSGLFALSRLSSLYALSIQTVEVQGADNDIAGSIQKVALNALEGKYLHLFSKSNTFIYPRDLVSSAVGSVSPRISSVKVKKSDMHTLEISVEEKAPKALVCANLPEFNGDSLSLENLDSCYFADTAGYIFASAPLFSGNIYNRYYAPDLSNTTSTENFVIGSYATSSAEFTKLQEFYEGARLFGVDVLAILIKEAGEYELYARNSIQDQIVSTSSINAMVVYFNNSRSFRDQLVNLLSFWTKMKDQARSKGEVVNFDYIDVRYGSNVFYRTI
jgi:hypothetical protein